MKQAIRRTQDEARTVLVDQRNGRDEMNLVELPVFLLSTRAPAGQHVLDFEVEQFDRKLQQVVRRKLSVIGDPKFGLPTAPAEEVYLGLLHHTRAYNEFSDPLVYFSRGELLKTLGWKKKDSSYHRLTRSMDQIAGVRLKCHNYWRDNRCKEFRSVENISLIDYYRFRDSRNRGERNYKEYLSEFRWGSALFESFDAGYMKKLDLSIALRLKPLPRRLYRLLDKHFYAPHRTRLVYDLGELAHERLGMSRSYDAAQIRRYLQPAIEDLVENGFIAPMPAEHRFQSKAGCRGRWEVIFAMKTPSHSDSKPAKPWKVLSRRQGKSVRPELRVFRNGQFVE